MLGQREYQKADYLTRIFYDSVTQQGITTMTVAPIASYDARLEFNE
jgi:hypothetical protein